MVKYRRKRYSKSSRYSSARPRRRRRRSSSRTEAPRGRTFLGEVKNIARRRTAPWVVSKSSSFVKSPFRKRAKRKALIRQKQRDYDKGLNSGKLPEFKDNYEQRSTPDLGRVDKKQAKKGYAEFDESI